MYSAGCQVIRLYEQQKMFMSLCHNSWQNKFSYSLFDGLAAQPESTLPLVPKVGAKPGYYT